MGKNSEEGEGVGRKAGGGEGREPVDKGLQPPFRSLVINLSLICHQHVIISVDALECNRSHVKMTGCGKLRAFF